MTTVSGSGPTVFRILLGAELRRLREDLGITPRDAALAIRGSSSKISRMERGRHAFKVADVDDLLVFYDVTDETRRKELLELARRANQPGWWGGYQDILPNWFQPYVGLEQAALRIRTFENQYVPGLLQTPEYAASVIALHESKPEEIERRVTLRMERQRRFLDGDGDLRLWAVVDEAALCRRFGGAGVMRSQLEHLLELAKHPNLSLQIAPFALGGLSTPGGFTILRFADAKLPDVVYVEQLTDATYIEKRDEVDVYTVAMERLCIAGTTHEQTVAFIDRMLAE